jgi:FkbM family methyltransferase
VEGINMFHNLSTKIVERINRARYCRFAKTAKRPEEYGDRKKLKNEGYFSQNGQDKWIAEEIFSDRRSGVFVDIGAHDGMSISNTFFLEKELGWNGLAVEPIPYIYEKLTHNRNCTTINACVGAQDGTAIFRVITGYPEQLSGLVDQYHPTHLDRIEKEISIYGGSYQDIEISCYSINTLLDENGLYNIDYLSIDVEGSELSIINELDFNRFQVAVISIENNYSDFRIPKLLLEREFVFHSIVGDEFYVNRAMSSIAASSNLR